MATLTISIVSGLGTTTDVVTFSNADAQRILAGFRKTTEAPAATQQDLTDFLRKQTLNIFNQWVNRSEVVVTTPVPPTYS